MTKETEKDITLNIGVEQFLWGRGYDRVAGVDEAGRGAWGGPIVAAAVVLPQHRIFEGIKDSKKLSPKKLLTLEKIIRAYATQCFASSRTAHYIDTRGIDFANCKAMVTAINNVEHDAIVIDGVHIASLVEVQLKRHLDLHKPIEGYDKGESKSQAIAAASIIAKTYRDALMLGVDARFPEYGFANHKGYGTQEHRDAIIKHGFCDAHRKTFRIKGLDYLYK